MRVIKNRPEAIEGSTEYYTVTFCEKPLLLDGSRNIWSIDRTPEFSEKKPLLFLPGKLLDSGEQVKDEYAQLAMEFNNLPLDKFLKDGATFRYRRFGVYLLDSESPSTEPRLLPARKYFQNAELNNYAGGIKRQFEPLTETFNSSSLLKEMIINLFALIPENTRKESRFWEAGVHPTRVVGSSREVGYGAPEGLHQDGHIYASIILIGRHNVTGGESIFADKNKVVFWRQPLLLPGDVVLWRDAWCWHDVSPITPRQPEQVATRDIIGISFNYYRED
jgi:hypothetical protein